MSVVIEETEIFQSLTKKLLEFSEYFKNVAHAIAVIDVSTGKFNRFFHLLIAYSLSGTGSHQQLRPPETGGLLQFGH